MRGATTHEPLARETLKIGTRQSTSQSLAVQLTFAIQGSEYREPLTQRGDPALAEELAVLNW
jgi:hypothetical protein